MSILDTSVKIIIICVAAAGLYSGSGMAHKKFTRDVFIYFTTLSVVFCFAYFLVFIVLDMFGIGGGSLMGFIHGAVILCVTVTMAVYHLVLIPNLRSRIENFKIFSLPNLCMHYAVPLLTIAHWVIFSEKGQFTYYYPFLWTVFFLVYFFAVIIRAKAGACIAGTESKYPYYFIDIDAIGFKKTARNVAALAAVIVALGYVLVFVDSLLS